MSEVDQATGAESKRNNQVRTMHRTVENIHDDYLAGALRLNRRERVWNRITLDCGPKFAPSRAEFTNVGELIVGGVAGAVTAQSGAVPTRPITEDLTTVIGAGPVVVSIVSTPCRKETAISFHRLKCVAFDGGYGRSVSWCGWCFAAGCHSTNRI